MTEATVRDAMWSPQVRVGTPDAVLRRSFGFGSLAELIESRKSTLPLKAVSEVTSQFVRTATSECEHYNLDMDLYCYVSVKSLYAGRDVRRFNEMKVRIETWLRANREDRGSMWCLEQMASCLLLVQSQTALERYIFGGWRSEGRLSVGGKLTATHALHEFSTTGQIPKNDRSLFKWFTRRRAIPTR